MHVKDIIWIDKDAEESLILITDGIHECIAFCQPCRIKVNHALTSPLYSLSEKKIVLVDANTSPEIARQSSDNWSHHVVAVIEDKDKKIVAVGNIKLVLSHLPGDLKNGDMIECYPDRLDFIA